MFQTTVEAIGAVSSLYWKFQTWTGTLVSCSEHTSEEDTDD